MVPEADHLIAFPLEKGGAGRIRRFFMLAAIDLHDQAAGMRREISKIGADRYLATEFRGGQTGAELRP